MISVRKPAVAGYFYPGDKNELQKTIASFLKKQKPSAHKEIAKGIILPHAGYAYSGYVAAQTVSSCNLRNRLIILGPNHTGDGELFSVMTEGSWRTPFGDVVIDSELATKLVAQSKYLKADTVAHRSEHCIEVLLPFLQILKKEIQIVPILVSHTSSNAHKDVAKEILEVIKQSNMENEISIVASSDMTHYETQESANKKDNLAIESILNLDPEGLLKRVNQYNITMCGVIAVYILIEVLKGLGATHADLIKYQTSGDTTGDFSSVVGYAGIRIN